MGVLQVRKAAVDLFVEAYMLEGTACDGYIADLKPSLQVRSLAFSFSQCVCVCVCVCVWRE
eukprot:COSAG05_NODE_2326_length_3231_cov_38.996096_7_plen_61_part_00